MMGTCTYDGQIGLLHQFVCGEEFVQPGKCLACLGKEYAAAHGSVQSVHHSQIYVARLGILIFQIALYGLRQRFVASLVSLHDFPRPLVYHDEVIVFVEYFHLLCLSQKEIARHTG